MIYKHLIPTEKFLYVKRLFVVFFLFGMVNVLFFPFLSRAENLSGTEEEERLGNLLDVYVTGSFVMLRNDDLEEKVSGIAEKILSVSVASGSELRVRIINDARPVASSFPGYLYVSTGMLDMLDNENELAAVLSHASAHMIEKTQYHAYKDAEKEEKIASVTGQLIPLLAFTGLGGAAIAGASLSASTVNPILAIVSATYGSTAVLTDTTFGREEKKIAMNRLGPYLYLPDKKLNFSSLVFFEEIYTGYKKDDEIRADTLAINYLHKAGYDPKAFIAVLGKIAGAKNELVEKGYIFHLFSAAPGLEKRILNARKIIENSN